MVGKVQPSTRCGRRMPVAAIDQLSLVTPALVLSWRRCGASIGEFKRLLANCIAIFFFQLSSSVQQDSHLGKAELGRKTATWAR